MTDPGTGDGRRLVDKVAVITGAAWGIGRATARLFAAHGARLVLVDVDGPTNDALAAELADAGAVVAARTADADDVAAIGAIAQEVLAVHGRTDVLVNNAGIMQLTTIQGATPAQWDADMSANLRSVFTCSRAFLPGLLRSDAGAIVNNASVDGVLGNHHLALYSVAKAGMVGMTRVMAAEFAPMGIRVNAVAPALIENESMATMTGDRAKILDGLVANTPMGRRGRPAEVANVMLFLATADSSYVTGATIAVDGGRTHLTPGTFAS